MSHREYHAAFLDLNGRKCLVVGGGVIASEKVSSLLEAGAQVQVVAPVACARLRQLAAEDLIEWIPRSFLDEDVANSFLSIGATEDESINRSVFRAAESLGRLGNAVDDPEFCNFIFAAVAKVGPVQVAVSSAGCSPALAQQLRNRIQNEFLSDAVGSAAEFLGRWRPAVKARIAEYAERKRFWQGVLDSEVLLLAANGTAKAANAAMAHRLDVFCYTDSAEKEKDPVLPKREMA